MNIQEQMYGNEIAIGNLNTTYKSCASACVVTDRCFVKDGDKSDTLEIVKVDSTCGRLVKY